MSVYLLQLDTAIMNPEMEKRIANPYKIKN